MSKLTFQIVIIGIVIAAAATLNIRGVQASEGAEILQISVRAQSTANYNVDTDLGTIPAISIDIVDDKINDGSSDGSNPPLAPLPTTALTQDNPEPAGPAPQATSEPQETPLPQASPTPQGNTLVISGLNGNAGGNPDNNAGGNPNNNAGGNPDNNAGGNPNNNAGGNPDNNAGGNPDNNAGGNPNNNAGGNPNNNAGGNPDNNAGGNSKNNPGGNSNH